MSQKTNSFVKFWNELKRRKVFGVVTTYAATAYIIIEVVNNLIGPFRLPEWVPTLIAFILVAGLPVVIVLSWIFDFTTHGIKKTESLEEAESKGIVTKHIKRKLSASYVLNLILIIAVIVLAYPKIFKQDTLEKLRSSGERLSVAVMPFQNMTNDTTWNIWQDGIQNELITSLTNSEELKVRQTESVNALLHGRGLTNYASITSSVASNISQKLDANIFIYGSIKQVGDIIRINAQLIDSKTEDTYKSFQIDGTAENFLHITDSLSLMVNNFLITSILKKEVSLVYTQHLGTPKSPDALRNFINGQNAFAKREYPEAREMFLNAIKIDSNFTMATILLAFAYGNQSLYPDAKKWILKAYEQKDNMSTINKASTEWAHAVFFGTPYEQLKYFKQLQDIDEQQAGIIYNIGVLYNSIYQYDKAIIEFEKSLVIFKKWKIKPSWVFNYTDLGYAYHKTDHFKKEKKLYKKAEQDFPDDRDLIYRQTVLSLTEGDTITANRHIENYSLISKENLIPEGQITTNLAGIYSEAGLLDRAEEYFRKILLSEPENPDRINTLGYFLIDKDRDVNEGMALVDKALELNPENFDYLHTKGWGLYKQRKYQESLDVLQKSWDLRREKAIYDYESYLHLEAAKKAVSEQKNN
jgi:TolB-like protein/Tfp pilus assembly protein PilF